MRQRVVRSAQPDASPTSTTGRSPIRGVAPHVVEHQVVTRTTAERRVVSRRRFDPAAVLMVTAASPSP